MPNTSPEPTFAFHASDLAATTRLAAALAAYARAGDVIALHGDLGVGKTAFARAFIRAALGQEADVPSPTFNIVITYPAASVTIWHFDLYRLRSPEELFELGLEDAFAEGIALVEWPDRLGSAIPETALDVVIEAGAGEERVFRLGSRDMRAWRERLAAIAAALGQKL